MASVNHNVEYPFAAEYAKSSRATCKGCKNTITQDSLRLAIMVQSPAFDGKIPNWYHFDCFFKKGRVKSVSDIKNFETLRWEDQQKIEKAMMGKTDGKGQKSGKEDTSAFMAQFAIEYAKSNRSSCKTCQDKIEKNAVRVSVKDMADFRGPMDRWHHLQCFLDNKDELIDDEESFDIERMSGFALLKPEDQKDVKSKFPKQKKRKATDENDGPAAKKSKEDLEMEKALKEQNDLIWRYRDELMKNVSKNALIGLLEYNNQEAASGESNLLDRVSDAMVFGALKHCPECKNGQLVYSRSGYRCSGNLTEWTRCTYLTKTPEREEFKVPKEYHDVSFLMKYKYVKRERLFPPNVDGDGVDGPVQGKKADSNKPLADMRFVVTKGPFSNGKTKKILELTIRELGGKIATKVDDNTAAVISTKVEVEASEVPLFIAAAKNHDVHVVSQEFLDSAEKVDIAESIKAHSIASWGENPLKRIGNAPAVVKGSGALARHEKAFKKNLGAVKMTIKGGAAVDPESGLESSAHILKDPSGDKAPLNAILGTVDLISGVNSYYRLQALENDTGKSCHVFRAWGRIGTKIGGTKLEHFHAKEAAAALFKELYLEKTGNHWEARANFEKKPGKFYPMDVDYGESEEVTVDMSKSNSKLPAPVQDLIRFIFDIESMKNAMMEFEIDLNKMPLGKISKKQIEKAYKVLGELNDLIEKGGSQTQFVDATTRFYTLIPHDFGMQRPPIIDSAHMVKSKLEMLDSLLEIEVAYNMLKTGQGEDPIDSHYAKLNSEIVPLDKESDEYKRLVEYVANTHAPSHTNYKLEVAEIYEIKRQGEESRFKPFKKLHNHMLLWHGSRRTNWAGIISQGLRIAPPEAPATGYMFGKGIYFADMVSKSANYCFTNQANPEGLLLLCEVALGNMTERNAADTQIKLKPNEHSCKGMGKTVPDPAGAYTSASGVVYPMGHSSSATQAKNSSLLYNEYIVYDIAQVQQKYLLRMKFKY